jgi:O-antigen ligase
MTKRKPKSEQQPAQRGSERLRVWLLGAAVALFVVQPLLPGESTAYTGDGMPIVMLSILLAAAWLLGAAWLAGATGHGSRIRFGPTDAAVVVLVLLHTAAALYAARHGSPRPAVNMLWQWIGLAVMFFLARQLIATGREARAVAAVMIALTVALSSYGLYQYFVEQPRTQAEAKDPERLDRMLREAGLWYPPGSPERLQFENRLFSTEPLATFALTNSLAGLLAPWLVVAVGIGVGLGFGAGLGFGRRDGWSWAGVAISVAVLAACLVLTKSRSAYGATALGLVLVGLVGRQRRGRLGWRLPAVAAAVAALLLATAVAIGGLDIEVLSEAKKSLGYRVEYWRATVDMIADHPWTGCGPGNFQHTYTTYKLPGASEEVAEPHNFLLEVWATAGTPTMLALLVVLGCFGWTLRRHVLGATAGSSSSAQNTVGQANRGTRALPQPPRTDATAFVLGGALFGFILAWPLGLLGTTVPAPAVLLLGLPAAACVVAAMFGWIRGGRMGPAAPAIGVVVLLVNLLAAGGIAFPGVAGTLWLLMALGLHATDPAATRLLRRPVAVTALVVFLAAAAACYWTAYAPVLGAQSEMHQAQQARPDMLKTIRHLEKAAEADPLAADPWNQLATLSFARWQVDHDPNTLGQFEQYNDTALSLAPNSSPAWIMTADRYLEVFLKGKTRRRSDLDQSLAAYRRAIRLYPTNAVYRAKYAVALEVAGDAAGFDREAREALRLDDLTHHHDKKIPPELRNRLMRRGLKP